MVHIFAIFLAKESGTVFINYVRLHSQKATMSVYMLHNATAWNINSYSQSTIRSLFSPLKIRNVKNRIQKLDNPPTKRLQQRFIISHPHPPRGFKALINNKDVTPLKIRAFYIFSWSFHKDGITVARNQSELSWVGWSDLSLNGLFQLTFYPNKSKGQLSSKPQSTI